MADIFDFPTERIVYGNITNTNPSKAGGEPVFVSDILATQQEANASVRALAGIDYTNDSFFILQGLNYDGSSYTDGIIYFKADADEAGRFYFVAAFDKGNAILPDAPTGENAKLYTDAVIRPTYNYFTASPSAYSIGVTTPLFTGDMNVYRLANVFLKSQVNALNVIAASLKSAAFKDASATAANGIVPLWDNVYPKNQVLPITGGTLTGGLTLNADPTSALQAATKQYIDNNYIKILAKGYTHVGDISGYATKDIALGTTILVNYKVIMTVWNSTNTDGRITWFIDSLNSNSTSFRVAYQAMVDSGTQDLYFDWFVIAR